MQTVKKYKPYLVPQVGLTIGTPPKYGLHPHEYYNFTVTVTAVTVAPQERKSERKSNTLHRYIISFLPNWRAIPKEVGNLLHQYIGYPKKRGRERETAILFIKVLVLRYYLALPLGRQ